MFGSGKKTATLGFKEMPKVFVADSPQSVKLMLDVIFDKVKPPDIPHQWFMTAIKHVPRNTKVEVIELQVDNGLAKVKILEGEHQGYEGWVPSPFLQ